MTRTSSRRAGFTLVELMVAIVLVGIVLGSLINVIVRQLVQVLPTVPTTKGPVVRLYDAFLVCLSACIHQGQ